MEKHSVMERIESIASEIAKKMGVEFVHAEVAGTKRNMTVRVFIDKPEGVSIEDCSNFSREIEEVLDADDFIPSAYVLEVSSPGIERQLYSVADFQRFAGELAKVKTSVEIDGQKNFTGRIREIEGETINFEDTTRGMIQIPFASISKANLKIDLGKEFKKVRPEKKVPRISAPEKAN
ncbi:MAG TPA: ribosome maturation factor RimP [Pyrinomonadaceae bacterium]|nr:ribosome maturation factor RimP [Pyrinomonadaceae bacterium]